MRSACLFVAWLAAAFTCAPAALAQLDGISSREAASGLKAALERGSTAAVAKLGRNDGFYANPQVKIPLPESLRRAEKLMRRFGMASQADGLILALNRAAEAAVPEAKSLLIDAVRRMTVEDAKSILQGGETAGTAYFRRTSEHRLRERFAPVVRRATREVHLAQHYNDYARKGVALGLVDEADANLDDYVTQKALDGLYLMLAEEERKIRRDPVASGATIIRKVFGALVQ